MSVHCNIKMTIKKKHSPRGTGDEIAGRFLLTASSCAAAEPLPRSWPQAVRSHCTAFLRGRLSLAHSRWGCLAQLHQLNFQFTRKIKSESSKEFMELCIIYLWLQSPKGIRLQSFTLDLDINLGNCIKIIYRNALYFCTVTSHFISLSLKMPFFNSLY